MRKSRREEVGTPSFPALRSEQRRRRAERIRSPDEFETARGENEKDGRKADQFSFKLRSTRGKSRAKAGTNLRLSSSSRDDSLAFLDGKLLGHLLERLLHRPGEGSELEGDGGHGEEEVGWVGWSKREDWVEICGRKVKR